MEKTTPNKPAESLTSITVALTALSLSAAMTYAYFLSNEPHFANYSAVAHWTAVVLGLVGFVFLWFYLMLEPLIARLPTAEAVNRRLHRLLGYLAAFMVSLDPLVSLMTGNWSALFGTTAGDHQIYVLAGRLAALLLIGWVIAVDRKFGKAGRKQAAVRSLVYLAMLLLLIYWKMAGGMYGFWFGKYSWIIFAVSFSVLTAWRWIPNEKKPDQGTDDQP